MQKTELSLSDESAISTSLAIYVPQGRIARLYGMSYHAISSLYTEHFSTCNILIFFNSSIGRLELAHIDMATAVAPQQLKSHVEGLKDDASDSSITLISREGDGQFVLDYLITYFSKNYPDKLLTIQHMEPTQDSIRVSMEKDSEDSFRLSINTYPIGQTPPHLLHHPQEQSFLAVQKIEQIIGVIERFKTDKVIIKQLCLFNGYFWESIPEKEMRVDTNHPFTQDEMVSFNKNHPLITVAGKLIGIIENGQREDVPFVGNVKEVALSIAPFIETYLNNNNYDMLLKRNLRELFNSSTYSSQSAEDSAFKKSVLLLLKERTNIIVKLEKLIEQYKVQPNETSVKKDILNECATFLKHCQQRKQYEDLSKEREEKIAFAKKLNEKAVFLYQQKSYEAAKNLGVSFKVCK